MNLGTLSKDIWGLILTYFEINFSPHTLNSLSLTCKKLNEIDNERKRRYIKQIDVKLKGRVDFISFIKYKSIDMVDMTTQKLSKYNENIMICVYPDLHKYLKILKVDKYEELLKLNKNATCQKFGICDKDIDLVCSQISVHFIFAIFSFIKNENDFINTIMELVRIL